ncbi:amidohydrolase family protein [Pontibacter sp. JH31]|uniref:Amidohydrolase family protein n=1 Tax=Pontibacter aquaedesilientis TaxID=2766980 RepID=A0ABR7XE34_9BACT|nr:amidohydrolase family protein [Pontibacter aquaedesilientis]MBD1396558.1 amidohydrolase family protein [Pontibacter aquaedesilientis]
MKINSKLWVTLGLSSLLGAVPALAQDQPHVFRGARIIPVAGQPIENGVLVVHHGKITGIGAASQVKVPTGAREFDMTGKVVMPGLVDTHSHLGEGSGGDASTPLHPDVRIIDGINPISDSFKRALAGGITTVNVMPGSGHLMSGQTVYLKMREGKTIGDLTFCDDVQNGICGGMKMANGTNPMKAAPFPGTRAKSAAMARQLFLDAQAYSNKIKAAKGKASKMPERKPNLEPLVEILEGKRVVHFHTHRYDDILTALRLKEEFGFKMVLHHVSEAWKAADEIAKAGVPASILTLDSPGGKAESVELSNTNGAALEKAGAIVGFHTDDGITDSRLFLRNAAFAVRSGMSPEKAIEGLTLVGARMLELQDRVGSLEIGKDADFVVLSGEPFSVYTRVEQTWVEGQKRFDLANPDDKKFAVGGYNTYNTEVHYHAH